MGSRVREIAFAWPPVATPADYSTYITTEKSGSLVVSSSAGQSQYQNQQQQNQHQKYNNQPQQYQQQHIAGPPLYQFTPCVPTIASAKPSAGRIQAASFAGMTCDLTNDDDDVTGGDGILSIASSTGSTTGPIVSPLHPTPQQISHHYAPQQATKVSQSTSLMSPLSGGGFIFNYPPLYSETPLSPFSRPHPVSASFAAIQQIPVNASMPSTPTSPTSPVSDSFSVPGSPLSCPVSPQFTNGMAPVVGRKEKLEKYKQKRTKRNHSRPVDQARRERAQLRTRDELGHFLACPKKPEKHQFEMEDVRNKLEAWMKESQALKDKLNQVESRLEEQQKINTQLLHENRILWSTVAPSDVFNTTRPGSSYSDAFKEKVDLTNIELNWTDSPYLGSMKLDDIEHWPLDVDSTLDFSSS